MNISLSNLFILLGVFLTLTSNEDKILQFGLNHFQLIDGNYLGLLLQIIFYSFLHGGIFHLLFNSLFLFLFGNPLEKIIGKKWYLGFFIFITLTNAGALLLLSRVGVTTIGISGFALAILAFYTLFLFEKKDSEYKGGVTALIINILIGIGGNISFIGHLFGAIFGGVFYIIYKLFHKK